MGPNVAAGCLSFDLIAARATTAAYERLAAIEAGVQFDAPVCIQFTSGTTGTPKGATLGHHNVINNAAQLAEAMGMHQQDRLCAPVPMFHCFWVRGERARMRAVGRHDGLHRACI
jgi:fatty-acyl-CoA synthase